MTAALPAAGFDIGRVISRLFGVVSRNFVAFLLLSILLVGLPTAATSFLQLAGMTRRWGRGPGPSSYNGPPWRSCRSPGGRDFSERGAAGRGDLGHGERSSGRPVTFGEASGPAFVSSCR